MGESIALDFVSSAPKNPSAKAMLFPTLATSDITVVADREMKTIEIFSINGTKISSQSIKNSEKLNISTLQSGSYIAKVITHDNENVFLRFVKK